MKTAALRPYQEKVVAEMMHAHASGARSILVVSPTGSGKTRMVSEFHARAGLSCAAFAHRREIVRQIADGMRDAGVTKFVSMGVRSASSLQTAGAKDLDTLFIDEAHHIAARSYLDVLRAGRDKLVIGATATPYRMDGALISPFFDAVVVAPTAAELAASGYLARVEYFAPQGVDFDGIKKNIQQDFDASEAFERIRISVQAGDILSAWQTHANHAPALLYCINQSHCDLVKDYLDKAGKKSEILTARTRVKDRNEIISDFESRRIDAIINCEILTEGTDIKGVGAIIMLRPTLSRGLYKQMIGRGLRPDAPCSIIDHVGNHDRHGDVLNENAAEIMARASNVRTANAGNGAKTPLVDRLRLHIERINAPFSRTWTSPAFRGGSARC